MRKINNVVVRGSCSTEKLKAHLPTLSDEEAVNALSGKLKFQPIPSGVEQGAGGGDKKQSMQILRLIE